MRTLTIAFLSLALVAPLAVPGNADQPTRPRVLFLSHSAGYEHEVVKRPAPGQLSLAETQLVKAPGLEVVATQDCSVLSTENLAGFDAVAFYTTGELPISAAARQALLDYVKQGGGFVGIHPATDTFYEFPAYGEMLGGYFDGHPWNEDVRVKVEDTEHPATAHLGEAFEIADEIYQFKAWDRKKLHVLLSLDTASVDMNNKNVRRQDGDFALAWTKQFGKGRVFYTALGHRPSVWKDARFLEHVMRGIRWALRREPQAAAGDHDAEGFTPLLDATHTEGWKQAGPGSFRVEDGVATTVGGMGLWYYEKKSYKNFILKLEFRQLKLSSNSGVFVRFPRVDGDPWIPVKEGYEIQIAGDKPAKNGTGSIYSFQAPTKVPLKPAGEWNEYEITCIGQNYIVRLNGELINRYVGSRSIAGMIGVQNHQEHKDNVVSYRNIRVLELPDRARDYHVLFDGTGREGWKMCGPGSFELTDGVLTSRGGMGMYWHERSFKDFTLLLDWKVVRKNDNSGVFVRFPDPGDDPWVAVHKGYEIQICDPAPAKHRTGSVYSFQDASRVPTHAPGAWNHYRIQVRGQEYTVWVNGKLVNRYTGDRSVEGHIGMQNHDDKSRVSFRNVRVVELE